MCKKQVIYLFNCINKNDKYNLLAIRENKWVSWGAGRKFFLNMSADNRKNIIME